MTLEMKQSCERCGQQLALDGEARICSHECTFCEACSGVMDYRCPNCAGELVLRPKRIIGEDRA